MRIQGGAVAGAIIPPGLVVVLTTTTAAERSFLDDVGWSAVRRTAVEWPSVLLLSDLGWLVATAFVAAGLLAAVFGFAVAAAAPTRIARLGGLFLVIAAFTLALVALKPDPAGTATSWHGRVHNVAYPVMLAAALAAAGLWAIGLRHVSGWRGQARAAAIAGVIVALATGLTNVAAIAQLARYILFAALLAWVEFLAADLLLVQRSR
jgi:hypothetical membrane protein